MIQVCSPSSSYRPLPSATGIFPVLRKALSYWECFDRSNSLPILSFSLSLFIYWRFLLKARIESVKREKKKGRRRRERAERLRMFETYLCKVRERVTGCGYQLKRPSMSAWFRSCFWIFLRLKFYEFPVFSGSRFSVLHSIAGITIRKTETLFVLCRAQGRNTR